MREHSGISRGRGRGVALGVVAAMLLSLVSTAASVPASAAPSQQARAASAPVLKNELGKVRSTVTGTWGGKGTMEGTFKPKRFTAVGDQLFVVGKLQADLVKANGNVKDTISERVKLPVVSAEGASLGAVPAPLGRASCDVLNLVLGPLDLDLLGLQISLDQVVLDIVAQSGAGNLLGNLLCAVAGLLDAGGLLEQVSQILNAVLALLRQ